MILTVKTRGSISLIIAALMFPLLGGCATILKGTTRDLDIRSEPPGAEVQIDGSYHGTTPVTVKLKSKEIHRVLLKKDGYKTQAYPIMNHVNPVWVCVDVFMLWVPALVDMLTGAWYEFDQKIIFVELEEIVDNR